MMNVGEVVVIWCSELGLGSRSYQVLFLTELSYTVTLH